MKTTRIAALAAAALSTAQLASGGILLAGWHEFQTLGPSGVVFGADEGILNQNLGALGTSLTVGQSGSSNIGGSTDNWYGPDSVTNGGMKTNQTPFADNGTYVQETASGPRLDAAFVETFTGPNPQPGTTLNGRILDIRGTDIFVLNNSTADWPLKSLVFDAFVSDTEDNGRSNASLTISPVQVAWGIPGAPDFSQDRPVTAAFAGVNTPGAAMDDLLPNVMMINNERDYGTGTNYLDYVVDLSGITLMAGESITFRFSAAGSGFARVDNIALFAVPEPGTVLTLSSLLLSGAFFRRRQSAKA